MSIVGIGLAGGHLVLQIPVHVGSDALVSDELSEAIGERRYKTRSQHWNVFSVPIMSKCRCNSVDAAQAFDQWPSSHGARRQLVRDKLLPARDGMRDPHEHIAVPPERCLKPGRVSQCGKCAGDRGARLVDPGAYACVTAVIVPELVREYSTELGL
jgi:hypothetical protein